MHTATCITQITQITRYKCMHLYVKKRQRISRIYNTMFSEPLKSRKSLEYQQFCQTIAIRLLFFEIFHICRVLVNLVSFSLQDSKLEIHRANTFFKDKSY